VQLFQPAPSDLWPISSDTARQLALTFGLTAADVRADARDVARWHGASDDLLTSIETRRTLDAATAATYLRNLRTALI